MARDPSRAGIEPIRSATRVVDLLDALQRTPHGLPLTELARSTGMPKSTALRYLATLADRRYVERDPASGIYRLGLAIPSQAQFFARLTQAVRPSLERLRDRFDETATLSVLDGNRTTLLDIVESRQAIRLGAERGDRSEMHSTAIGKAIAATLPEDFIRHVMETVGLRQFTAKTITEPSRFRAELERVRARGYAMTDEENELGTYGIAVALPTDKLRAAIGVSAPAMRFDPGAVPAIADALKSEARAIAATFDSRSG